MAEEAAGKPAEAARVSSPQRKKLIMIGIIAGFMVVEAVVAFVLIKHFSSAGNPAETRADNGLDVKEGSKFVPDSEVRIGEFRIQNSKGQQSYTVSFSVAVTITPTEKPKEAKEKKGEGEKEAAPTMSPEDAIVAAKAARIKDRFTRVIRSLEPECFAEPDLTTLKDKLKVEIADLLGHEMKIKDVLVTDFSKSVDN